MLTEEQEKIQEETRNRILLELAKNSELFTQKDIEILKGNYWINKELKQKQEEEQRIKELHEALIKPVTKFVEKIKQDPNVILEPAFWIFTYNKKSNIGRAYYGAGVNDYHKIRNCRSEITYLDRPKIKLSKNNIIEPLKLEYDIRKFNLSRDRYFIDDDLQISYKDLGIQV